MVMKWEWERYAADKQCIERALTMWKEWISKKETYNDDVAAQGTMYVVNHMKLRDHQVAVIFDFFDEYLNLLDCGEEQAEDFYKKNLWC
ncbi:hypothetical protein [Bacillus sp. GeD10]|jgi:hypothetical protein|uniref:hypothetical protein n=1 Tax=Bacillus sp. GeD10 TaxID=1301086 RepID=UPI0002D225DF|nr:hypothetical protein [Bacillus sp. GeD10]MEB9339957.1 hypothetical protein [Bacillus cereus]CCW03487.1 hypothetical protein EBGED10_1800 [Bacillus sp. GeD10]